MKRSVTIFPDGGIVVVDETGNSIVVKPLSAAAPEPTGVLYQADDFDDSGQQPDELAPPGPVCPCPTCRTRWS